MKNLVAQLPPVRPTGSTLRPPFTAYGHIDVISTEAGNRFPFLGPVRQTGGCEIYRRNTWRFHTQLRDCQSAVAVSR